MEFQNPKSEIYHIAFPLQTLRCLWTSDRGRGIRTSWKDSDKMREVLKKRHVGNYPQCWSGVNLGSGAGALVLVDLFALRLMSWGQTFLAAESSDLFEMVPCEPNLRIRDLALPWKPPCLGSWASQFLSSNSPWEFNPPVSHPSPGSRFPEGDPLQSLLQGSLWTQLVSRIFFRTKGFQDFEYLLILEQTFLCILLSRSCIQTSALYLAIHCLLDFLNLS